MNEPLTRPESDFLRKIEDASERQTFEGWDHSHRGIYMAAGGFVGAGEVRTEKRTHRITLSGVESKRRLLKFWHEYQAWKAARPKSLDRSHLSAEQRKLWDEHRSRVHEPEPSAGPLTQFPDLGAEILRALELFATAGGEDRRTPPTIHDVARQMTTPDRAVKGYRRELLIRSEYGSLPIPKGLTAKERRARRGPFRQKARRMTGCAKTFLGAVYAAGEQGEDLFDAFTRLAGEASGRCAYCDAPILGQAKMYGSNACKVRASRRRTGKLTRPAAKVRA